MVEKANLGGTEPKPDRLLKTASGAETGVSEKERSKQRLWYLKSKGSVEGPFPSGGIRRSLLLGRCGPDDQVSVDKESWARISDVPEVMPQEMRLAENEQDPVLLRARLREDERSGRDRRRNGKGRPSAPERRRTEPALSARHREAKTELRQISREKEMPVRSLLVVGLLVVTAIGYGLYLGGPETPPDPDCSLPPAARVDWRNCKMDNLAADGVNLDQANLGNGSFRRSHFTGTRLNAADLRYSDLSDADLSHAELREANMKGATLRNSDLSYADLSAADMRYTDLTGANLGGSALTGATLDYAIWTDGRACAKGSLGICIQTR